MSDAPASQAVYEEWLLERVVSSVRNGARTLYEIVAGAGGADPAAVHIALSRAIECGRLEESFLALAGIDSEHREDSVIEPLLPPPHPLDFEWRFSRLGAEYLLAKIAKQGVGDLCLIASTTVALLAGSFGWKGRLTAIDVNRPVLESASLLRPQIKAVCLDITRDTLPEIQASSVIVDPPWYPEYIPGFLWASAKLCATGGQVLLSVPGEGTRPAIAADRAEVFNLAALYGLEVVAVEQQSIAYETPLFERNAMRAAGVMPSVQFWRRGDLVILRRTAMLGGNRPNPPLGTEAWAEVSDDGVRIRFRSTVRRNRCCPQLRSIVPGDVLPTISRRDPRRTKVEVWTSGNRVYSCESPDILRVITVALVHGFPVADAVERFLDRQLGAVEERSVSEAMGQVARLLHIERNEYAAYVKELSGSDTRAA